MTTELTQVKRTFRRQDRELIKLINNIANGDHTSLSKLYDDTSRLIYGLAFRILSDQSAAEEVTIEVFMQVWKMAADYDENQSSPSTWLFMLTRSRAIDRFRSNSKRNFTEEYKEGYFATHVPDPEEASLAVQQRQIIHDALSNLGPKQRTALELAYFHGLSQCEIAKYMDQPLGTVKSWIRLAMEKLREKITLVDEETYGEA